MSFLRKTLKATAITLGLLTVACGLLWYKFSDDVSPEIKWHADNVLHGRTGLLGDLTTGELIRYIKLRMERRTNVEAVFLPTLNWLQSKIEQPIPPGPLPTFGKGQQTKSMPMLAGQTFSADLFPNSAEAIARAMNTAQAGQTILIEPGTYRFDQKIQTKFPGSATQPITLRASKPGQVTIDFQSVEGFVVSQPHWIFENLAIRGICKWHKDCEHAFHVVGNAHHTVIRNNLIVDFNAHIKVNGVGKQWPDDGIVESNTITNTGPRETHLPITPIDLVGASNWQVYDNVISQFIKTEGDKTSYGVFMKGGGSGGRVERNLIACTLKDISQPGARIGLSFGGGTTGEKFCRNERCNAEHTEGVAANNIIAYCNDFGIDINRSENITVAHNTLINTAGIDLRGSQSTANNYGNLLAGQILLRHGSRATNSMNSIADSALKLDPESDNAISWKVEPTAIPRIPQVSLDFCGQVRAGSTFPGAVVNLKSCAGQTKPILIFQP